MQLFEIVSFDLRCQICPPRQKFQISNSKCLEAILDIKTIISSPVLFSQIYNLFIEWSLTFHCKFDLLGQIRIYKVPIITSYTRYLEIFNEVFFWKWPLPSIEFQWISLAKNYQLGSDIKDQTLLKLSAPFLWMIVVLVYDLDS